MSRAVLSSWITARGMMAGMTVPVVPAAPAGARARARAALTQEITATARRQLATDGATGLSLRAVARELGMASSAIYRYFPSRDDLLTALIIEAYDDLGEAVEAREAAVRRSDLRGRWTAIAHGVRDWALAHPHEYALIYGSPVPGYAAPELTIGPASRVTRLLVALLVEMRATGHVPPRHRVPRAVHAAISPVHAFIAEGLPPELRPASVDVRFVPPYGDSLSLFSGVRALPSEDGSLFEDRTVPRSHRLPFTAAGTATLARAPDDHALCVDVPNPPDGWIVECASCSGPHVVAREGEVLRVPEGVLCTLDIRFREAPRVRARVRTPEGAPIAGAEVRFGMSTGDEGVRLFNASGTTDAQGEVSVVLWTGSRLPDWTPDRLVAVAYLPGRRAAVVEAPGAWYGTELAVVLGPERGGSTGIDGVLTMPGGRPATGIPLRLTSGTTWNGHVGLPVQRAMTDAEGRFHFTVPDDLLEVLDRGGSGLAVRVDAELLEDAPLDALWRRKLRNLPLGVLVPEQVGAGGRPQRLEARLEVPP